MSFAALVCIALVLTVGYFVVLLSAEAVSWLVSRVNLALHARRLQPQTARAMSPRRAHLS